MKVYVKTSTWITILIGWVILCAISACRQNAENLSYKDSLLQHTIPLGGKDTLSTGKNKLSNNDSVSAGHTNISLLPPIESAKYLSVQTAFELIYPKSDSYQDSLLRFLKYYNRRFSDIGKYEAYYVDVSCSKDSTARCICGDYHEQPFFGLSILYDPNSRQANVINVSYDFYSESEHYEMDFAIESNNTIILYKTGQTEGEGGMSEELSGNKVIIKVSKEGEIQVSESN